MQLRRVITGASFVSIALATPLQIHRRADNASSPCAAVSASVAAQSAVATPTVPAQLAYDCINSVPLNKSAALALVDAITPYIRWQSTTAYLKDPPQEYVEKIQDGVDVWGGLANIRTNIQSNWTKEFEVW